jgi:hypothetical protein
MFKEERNGSIKGSGLLGIALQFIIFFLLMTFSSLGKLLSLTLLALRLAWISIVDLSGQLINAAKSSLRFSKNTSQTSFKAISRIIPYPSNPSKSLYLSLPILMGNSKKRVFLGIIDKVLGRIEGWRAKTLSQAGRLVLIKLVAAALPFYVISSFLL